MPALTSTPIHSQTSLPPITSPSGTSALPSSTVTSGTPTPIHSQTSLPPRSSQASAKDLEKHTETDVSVHKSWRGDMPPGPQERAQQKAAEARALGKPTPGGSTASGAEYMRGGEDALKGSSRGGVSSGAGGAKGRAEKATEIGRNSNDVATTSGDAYNRPSAGATERRDRDEGARNIRGGAGTGMARETQEDVKTADPSAYTMGGKAKTDDDSEEGKAERKGEKETVKKSEKEVNIGDHGVKQMDGGVGSQKIGGSREQSKVITERSKL